MAGLRCLTRLQRMGYEAAPSLGIPWQRHDAFHSACGPQQAALGVVDQLESSDAIQLPARSPRNFWEVLEFRPDGTVLETWKTPEVLGLHPRDVSLFATETSLGQRAMLAPRNQAVLLRTETCRAVLYADHAVLFPAHKQKATLRIAQQVKFAIAQRSALPFELRVLEALLAESVRGLEGKGRRLSIVAETVLTDINSNFTNSSGELQRLIPIQRKLTEVKQDVKDLLGSLTDVVDDDATLRKLCLTERAAVVATGVHRQQGTMQAGKENHHSSNGAGTSNTHHQATASGSNGLHSTPPSPQPPEHPVPPWVHGRRSLWAPSDLRGQQGAGGGSTRTPSMRMAAAILESYEFKLTNVESHLKELEASMDQTQTVWHMQLDHQRNRVLRLNLLMSMASFGAMTMTVPAAFFGMNLHIGLESVPGMFGLVVKTSVVTGLLVSLLVYMYYKFGPKRRYKARLRDMRSLRDLLVFHIDDMEDLIEEIRKRGRVSKAEFQTIVQEAVDGKPMSPDEISLLYRVFENNESVFMEMSKKVKMEQELDDFSQTYLQ